MSLAALGVNILVGYCGQISLGSGAFMAVGAYGAFNFFVRMPWHALDPALILGGLCATFFGILFGLPSLRVKGLYLAVATLAAQFFSDWMFLRIKWFTNDSDSGSVSVSNLQVFGMPIDSAACPSTCSVCRILLPYRGLAGQEPGAQRHRPRVDGHPRHGRGRSGDRHPPDVRQAERVRRELLHRRCGRRAVGLRAPGFVGAGRVLSRNLVPLLFMVIIGGMGSIMGSVLWRCLHRGAADLS
jgi:ABC-type branched-subunit amino acid transport system permease subunit